MPRPLLRLIRAAALASFVWFIAVDWCRFEESCRDCGHGRRSLQYRVFGIPVRESRHDYSPTLLELIASDLDVPCRHPSFAGWCAQRWRGLCVPVQSACAIRIGGSVEYRTCGRSLVRDRLRDDPKLGEIFQRKVFIEHDEQYGRDFARGLLKECPAD